MTRGIHLKRLRSSDLGLLGLPGPEPQAAADGRADESPLPPGTEVPDAMAGRGAARAAPPANPQRPMESGAAPADEPAGEPEDPERELAELTREIRLGLEDTLRLLSQEPQPSDRG